LERLPAIRHVDAAEGAVAIGDLAARPASADFDVGVLANVFERFEVGVVRDVVVLRPLEDARQVAAV
jgi:hypothetical protein